MAVHAGMAKKVGKGAPQAPGSSGYEQLQFAQNVRDARTYACSTPVGAYSTTLPIALSAAPASAGNPTGVNFSF